MTSQMQKEISLYDLRLEEIALYLFKVVEVP